MGGGRAFVAEQRWEVQLAESRQVANLDTNSVKVATGQNR